MREGAPVPARAPARCPPPAPVAPLPPRCPPPARPLPCPPRHHTDTIDGVADKFVDGVADVRLREPQRARHTARVHVHRTRAELALRGLWPWVRARAGAARVRVQLSHCLFDKRRGLSKDSGRAHGHDEDARIVLHRAVRRATKILQQVGEEGARVDPRGSHCVGPIRAGATI